MMLAGFLFLLLLTVCYVDNSENRGHCSWKETLLVIFLIAILQCGGSASNFSAQPELLDYPKESIHSFEDSGSTSSYSEYEAFDYNFYFDEIDTDWINSEVKCSYQDLFEYLNLTKNNDLYTMARPVKHHKKTTSVYLKMEISDILDVREIDQTLVLYVWLYTSWDNHHIKWDPDKFCGLLHIIVPSEVLWKPDLIIEEVTEKDKAPPSPYIAVRFHGRVELKNNQVLVSSCRMQVYKFPFDIQSCNLSFKSALHSDKEIMFEAFLNTSKIKMVENQYEWLFINMTMTNLTVKQETINNFKYNQSMIIYTITMKRRSLLYIANFILPILFFLCLDLASFLISDTGGEKLGFKVTVLLAVTVMQLILSDILPSSDRIPLIAVYCIGIFGLMMLSLLETILVMYLLEKDNEADKDQSLSEDSGDKQGKANFHKYDGEVKKWTQSAFVCDVSADEPPSKLLSKAKEGSSTQLMEESNVLEKVSDELREAVTLLLNSRKEERKPGFWTRVTKTINKVFFISYVTVASLFLIVIFSIWKTTADE